MSVRIEVRGKHAAAAESVLRNAKVRRAQLYYLRDRQGKSARLKEKRFVAS